MRRVMTSAVMVSVAVGLLVLGLNAAAKPVTSRAGEIEIEADGGFSPKALPKKKPAPITFNIEGKVRRLNPDPELQHPPALQELDIEGDKHVTVNVKGIPVCRAGKIQSTDTAAARKACGPALIGTGKTTVGVKFPEQKEIDVNSQLLAFNGGERGGVTTLFVHAYFSAPVTGAIVTTVKIKKIHKGRFGTLSVATIPRIAGDGAVKSFSLTLNKGVLWATCTDGKLEARGTAHFEDGTKLSATVVKPCTPKG